MANYKATGKKAGYGVELAQRTRGAILGALNVMESRGKSIADILAKELEENPIRFMELASKFIPKDIQAEITHTINASELTDSDLAHIATSSSAGITEAQESETNLH
jgi:hypothetical protein